MEKAKTRKIKKWDEVHGEHEVKILNHSDDDDEPEDGWKREKKYPYPALHRLSQDVVTFPQLIQRIDQILDKFGKIRDNATPIRSAV